MLRNILDQETSPYLLQHKDNPVFWQPWGAAALDLAQELGRPILLSVGYAACHWCHVMAHESFENPDIAALMNELFINVKVDREERPDIDALYMMALGLMNQPGGWPLTLFLTPRGAPFWGGTYFPPVSGYGRPGFADVLRQVHKAYHAERDNVARNAAAITTALNAQGARPGDLPGDLLESAASDLLALVDKTHGGLQGAPKFPQPASFELLWRAFLRSGKAALAEAVELTLSRMAQGGIYDHLGGGFARYAVDHLWLVPHFEKMLYDNAQLIELMTLVWQHNRSPLLKTRVYESVRWLFAEMTAEGGAFAASLDADSDGEEGKFYVWSEAEIDAVLGENAAFFKKIYGVTSHGNWEGKNILTRMDSPALLEPDQEAALLEARAALLEARARRVRPGWDDKILADWNGLTIAALANAGAAFGEPDWIAAAARAFRFIATAMTSPDGRLLHSYRAGRARHSALLDDYANLCHAALCLHDVTGDKTYIDQCLAWARLVERHYGDAPNGGFYFTADDAEGLIARSQTPHDQPTPSGNGVMVGVCGRLAALTGDAHWRGLAERALRAFAEPLTRHAIHCAGLVNGLDTLTNLVHIVLIGDREKADCQAFLAEIFRRSLPARLIEVIPPDAALPPGHPAAEKHQYEGRLTAYVCCGQSCSAPVTDLADFSALLT
jgi:uncharacterized protein YyaL (SSP411 family)